MVSQHRRLEVRGRVAFCMPILPALPRNRPLQRRRQIPPHVRIRPFLDRDRRRGVRHEDVQEPVPPTAPGGGLLQ